MAKIAVLVSIYNSGEWLENRIINLLCSKAINDCDIYCLNADSPDPRDDAIMQKYLNLPNIKYVKLSNRNSVYEAWNTMIQDSSSDFITNANTDDIVSPDCYSKLANILSSDDKYGFAYPSWLVTAKPNLQWTENMLSSSDISRDGDPGQYCGDVAKAGVGHFPMWRRSLHDIVGYFDPRYKALGDADFWARSYHIAKAHFVWVREYLGCYLWRNGNNLWHTEISAEEWQLYHDNVAKYTQQ